MSWRPSLLLALSHPGLLSALLVGVLHPPQGLCTCYVCCLDHFVLITLQETMSIVQTGSVFFFAHQRIPSAQPGVEKPYKKGLWAE